MMNLSMTTTSRPFVEFEDFHEPHCPKDALTDLFGWVAQGLLAFVAFSSLVGELAFDEFFCCWMLMLLLL